MTSPRPRRGRSGAWLAAALLLATVLGAAWLARSMSDRGLTGNPAMNPGMPGMSQQNMPGMGGAPAPATP
ncbi:hypothetical protein DAETH_45170 (plasmid) [Deinococcus aetherius]|uniref:Uncharacterized protein n=1 Tax=Deinococcus aetherius TaxID=200252 RepID=A0ABM8AL36_9DEIO|nr:hypothetical protein [Deinococcus aetherius]BDP44548.1 hypothetical protein DAETH_45170 [Deinococcus aetherius]